MVPGAVSVEAEPSTVQVAVGQPTVNDATGATFGAEPWSLRSTTVHIVALADETALVAVRGVVWPIGAGVLASEATAEIRPVPTPATMLRWVWPAGSVQAVLVLADLSAQ